jgi:hypothetical protein
MAMSAQARKRISEGMRRRHQEKRLEANGHPLSAAKTLLDQPLTTPTQPSTTLIPPSIPLTGEDVSLLVDVVTRATQRQIEFIQSELDVQQAQHLMNLRLRLLQIASTL